ncbi:S1 family peptidase [Alteromonas sp. CYL-A6]|uniref:S1 family peptidase n=1 Tax=Alteromonas nitratireducens TaxID=3390813 RepID=UPI0034B2E9AB
MKYGYRVILLMLTWAVSTSFGYASSLPDTVERVTPSVVAIGLYSPLDSPAPNVLGTGFVIGDGRTVVTNYHVVEKVLDPTIVQYYTVLSGEGRQVMQYKAKVDKVDPKHDLALLTINETLPAMTLADKNYERPGSAIAFTGFPIGAINGLYHATHTGVLAAVTPDAIPTRDSSQLSLKMLERLEAPDLIYQLDAIAYPGNSGSPVYLPDTGEVIGVISKVLVRDTKESALSSPTGITYAVPVKELLALINRK